MPITERKICCTLNEQLEHLLLARHMGWQLVDKNIKSLWSGFQDELIGVGVSDGVDTPTHPPIGGQEWNTC